MKNKKFSSISDKKTIEQIFSIAKIVSDRYYLVRFITSDSPRVGITISKKNFKRAVVRNKIRRQIRSFIYNSNNIPQKNIFIIVKNTYDYKNHIEMQKSLNSLFQKIK